jgi:hypothetical protein
MALALRHEPHRQMEGPENRHDVWAPKVTLRFSTTCCLSSTATDRASPNSQNLAVLSRPTSAPAIGTLCHLNLALYRFGLITPLRVGSNSNHAARANMDSGPCTQQGARRASDPCLLSARYPSSRFAAQVIRKEPERSREHEKDCTSKNCRPRKFTDSPRELQSNLNKVVGATNVQKQPAAMGTGWKPIRPALLRG